MVGLGLECSRLLDTSIERILFSDLIVWCLFFSAFAIKIISCAHLCLAQA